MLISNCSVKDVSLSSDKPWILENFGGPQAPGVSIFGISVPFTPEGNHTNNEYEVFFKYVLQISNLHAHMSA